MFLFPDATRIPLTTLAVGTVVNVLAHEGDWYRVVFRDPALGDRTGYVQAGNIRIETPAPATVPAPLPRLPGAIPQRTEPRPSVRPIARPRFARWAEHGYVSLNGVYQTSSNAFTSATTLTRYVESGSVTASYAARRPPVVDVNATGRVWRNLAVGAAATFLTKNGDVNVSASLPHPFYFNAPRSVPGVAGGVSREELAIHGQLSWFVPSGRASQLAIFAGPSYFHLKQGLVIDVNAAETYPDDAATFVSATTVSVSKSQLGFNAGVDLGTRLAKHVGAGVIVRYSRASFQLPSSAAETVTVRAGGFQIGGGIRVAF
jgi:hypothetical protein